MKEVYTHINKKLYYFTLIVVITVMVLGLFTTNLRFDRLEFGFGVHGLLVVLLSACLLLYPKYVSHFFRTILIIVAGVYFYTIFFLYPETWSNFIFLCLIPALSILFFDSRLFYFSLLLNSVAIVLTFIYIIVNDHGNAYAYMSRDLIGNIFNFVGSQAIIYFIFHLSYDRMKKQQLYYEQIEQSERMKTTGQLAAAVAHEIRNPLTVVKGFLQLYEKDQSFNHDIKKHFTLMIDELKIAEQVITQFLSITKPNQEKEMEAVNVKAVLQSVTDLLNSYGLLRDNKIELDAVEDCYIAASNIELKQLLINMIKNAIEASKKGDSVFVTAVRNKNVVEIKIIDYGCGMSKAEIRSLGTPFYSLKSKGTGLGLMICYNIATKYKGSIDVQSSKGEGTTVTIRFPYWYVNERI